MQSLLHSGKLKIAALLSCTLLFSACGQNSSWVKDVQVRTYNRGSDLYAEVVTSLNMAGLSLPALDIPIPNPRNLGQTIGMLSIHPSLTQGASMDVSLGVNLTAVTGIPGLGVTPTLPNGSPIPVAGYDPNSIHMFAIPGSTSRVYFGIDMNRKQALVGVAVAIKQLDLVGQWAGGANVFPSFTLANGVNGVIGVFTGGPGQNGLAFFLDASTLLLNNKVVTQTVATASAKVSNKVTASSVSTPRPLTFVEKRGSYYQEYLIYQELSRMSRDNTKLTVH